MQKRGSLGWVVHNAAEKYLSEHESLPRADESRLYRLR